MDTKRKIVWQKWIDPFLTNIDEIELPDVPDDDNEGGYRDSYQSMEEHLFRQPQRTNTGPVMMGPMGIIPLSEHNAPSKVYIFWMGHTNFDITPEVAKTIEETPGVETLDVFTRYRFRVAIGKAFTDPEKSPFGGEVLKEIQKRLCPEKEIKQERVAEPKVTVTAEKKPAKTNLSLLKRHLKSKYEHWAIFASPDGTLQTTGAKTKEEVMKEVQQHTTAPLATSWE